MERPEISSLPLLQRTPHCIEGGDEFSHKLILHLVSPNFIQTGADPNIRSSIINHILDFLVGSNSFGENFDKI